ncbi:MAG: hypothetical protein AAGI53_02385 [Planctomycetota bacterium]
MFGRRYSESDFWRWLDTSDALRRDTNALLADVTKRLHRFHPSLTCEIGPATQRPRELVLSADGIREAAEFVERIADAAPTLKDWSVIRFRPARPDYASIALAIGDESFEHEDLRVVLMPEKAVIHCGLFARWCEEPEGTGPDMPTFLMLDMAFGEFNMMTRIGAIDVFPLDAAPPHAIAWKDAKSAFDELAG